MRKLLIIGAIVLLLGGGAFGFHYVKSANAGAKSDEDKVAEKKNAKPGEFVELQPLILPIIGNSGITQTISLVVAIEVGNTADAKKVEKLAPKLQDAYIQDMYGVLNKQASLNSGVIQVKNLKYRLNKVSKDIAGDIVDDVLLQVVNQRPL